MMTPNRAVRTAAAVALIVGIGAIGSSGTAQAALSLGTTIDTGGADDNPGQKDLNQVTVNAPMAGTIGITFQFDDTTVPGGNTLDGCALFDSDGDGLADYALCHTINDAGTQTTTGYDCTADQREDRCTGPEIEAPLASTSTSAVVIDSDPFSDVTAHRETSACDTDPACYDDDIVVSLTAALADFGGAEAAELINVCSYPSMQPNSDPSDCITGPNEADLAITKSSSSDSVTAGGSFTYTLTITNNGPDTATGVTVTDSVPAPFDVSAVASTDMNCSFTDNDVVCTATSLALDATAAVTITVSVPAGATTATITNTAVVDAGTADPDRSNNTATDDVGAVATTTTIAPTTTIDDGAGGAIPTTVAPTTVNPAVVTLPPTGPTDTTNAVAAFAALFLLLGAGSLLAARRHS